jgi:hypothetical protein
MYRPRQRRCPRLEPVGGTLLHMLQQEGQRGEQELRIASLTTNENAKELVVLSPCERPPLFIEFLQSRCVGQASWMNEKIIASRRRNTLHNIHGVQLGPSCMDS